MEKYDLVILGGGPGGYLSAIRAAQRGLKTALVEKKYLGGTCLNWGCIPTKCLADVAHTMEKARRAAAQGVDFGTPAVDLPRLIGWKDRVVAGLRSGIGYLLKSHGVTVVNAEGRLAAADAIQAGEARLQAGHIILATGSVPARPGFLPVGDGRYLTSDELLALDRLPESLAVVGGGAIGVEFASIFASFGTRVAVYEMLPRLLPLEDPEVGRTIERAFKKRGITVQTDRPAERSELDRFQLVLVAIGRQPVTAGLGLEEAGVALDGKGFVRTGEDLQTSRPGIYAIGDIAGRGQLAYLAGEQGISVVEGILGNRRPVACEFLPSCVFTQPEVGTFGVTEEQAGREPGRYRIGRFPFTALGKAHCLGETEGFVKLVAETATGRIAGGQIVGPGAADLVHLASLAAASEGTVETVAEAIFGHPTLAESVKEAAADVLGLAAHLPARKAAGA